MAEKPKLAVIVGAGASHDCVSSRTNTFNEHLKPPLTKDLFANSAFFNTILRQYPLAEALSATIRIQTADPQDAQPLEAVLKTLAARSSLDEKMRFWEVPLYLQHLFFVVSEHFVTGGGTKFDALVTSIQASRYEEVLYLTLNYDLFLDRALQAAYVTRFENLSHYWRDRWALAKLHGSVNWGRPLLSRSPHFSPGTDMRKILRTLTSDLSLGNEVYVHPVRWELPADPQLPTIEKQNQQMDTIRSGGRPSNSYYPALSAPIEGKAEFYLPVDNIERIRTFLSDCTDFLIIGFSGLDTHVIKLFDTVRLVNKIDIVCGSASNGSATLKQFARRNQTFASVQRDFPRTRAPFDGGFSQYIDGGQLNRFLS